MKKLLLFVVALTCLNSLFGQINFNNLDKESFLLGTLDDYMGRSKTFSSKDNSRNHLVDTYYQQEKNIALFIDSIFKNEYTNLDLKNNGAPKGLSLHSTTLSKKVDLYFDYTPSGSYTVFHDTIYTGVLKQNIFTTEKQKKSFLTGFFFRHTLRGDNQKYAINLPNSASKAKLVSELLKELGCKDVEYVVKKDYIPAGHWIYFVPSENVAAIIKATSLSKN